MTEGAFIIRLCYSDEERWRFRADLFRSRVLPRLRRQSVPADIWVWTHPRHAAEAAQWPDVRTFTVDDPPEGHSVDIRRWRQVHGLPRYPIQILMGSDDLIGPGFVHTALDELAKIPGPHAIVAFQPLKYDLDTGRVFEMAPYTETYLPPFLALRQPTDDPRYNWVWAMGHTKLHHLVARVVLVPAGKCLLSVHGRNHTTGLLETERETGAPPWLV